MPARSLCQPGGSASCGACCGLYNFSDHRKPTIAAQMKRQTHVLRATPKNREAFTAAANALRAQQPPPAFKDVRVCPLLGYLDGANSQVGCLAHPLQNGGEDLRDCGVYTSAICESFECPSHIWLDEDEAALIRDACAGDWYLYGLVITDVDFVRALFRLLAREAGCEIKAPKLRQSPRAMSAITALFALKGRDEAGVFGRFCPEASGEPSLRTIEYGALGAAAAPEDDALLCLGLVPRTLVELQTARTAVHHGVAQVAAALQSDERSGEGNHSR